jgi:uncharacterized membrane protein
MTFEFIVNRIIELLNIGVLIFIALGIITFFWGIVIYIFRSGDEGKRKEGVNYIMYGILGIFVMVAVWGIVQIFSSMLGINVGIPQF